VWHWRKLKWGEFLKADWSTWKGRGPSGNRGGRSGRGGRTTDDWETGYGRCINSPDRGNQVSWRYNALVQAEEKAQEEGDLDDTSTSPVKKTDEEKSDRESLDTNAKRRLMLNVSSDGVRSQEETELAAAMAVDGAILDNSLIVGAGKTRVCQMLKEGQS
jgi:hypothetical protein